MHTFFLYPYSTRLLEKTKDDFKSYPDDFNRKDINLKTIIGEIGIVNAEIAMKYEKIGNKHMYDKYMKKSLKYMSFWSENFKTIDDIDRFIRKRDKYSKSKGVIVRKKSVRGK